MISLFTRIKNIFWPESRELRRRRAELTLWALVLSFAYLPISVGFLAWFSMARPIAIIAKLSPRDAFRAGFFYSFMVNLFQIFWVANVTPPGMVAAVVLMALYPAIIFYLFNKLYHIKKFLGLFMFPILWVGMEYFRTLGELSFPWTDLAYSQGYYLMFIQIASIIGGYGLSIIVAAFNIFSWKIFDRSVSIERRYTLTLIFAGTVALLFAYGWAVIPVYETNGKYNISLLQGNIPLEVKWKPETRHRNFEIYDSLTMIAKESKPNLIIWPETAAPCYPRHEYQYRSRLAETARKSGTNSMFGALDIVDYDKKRRTYNSAFQFDSSGNISDFYHKIKLVPFSEHSPYRSYLPFLTRDFLQEYITAIKTHDVQWWSNFYSGDSIKLFTADSVDYSVLICYEVGFPEFVRQGVLKGAQFLTNITNDTWFGRSPGPYQHMRFAVFRAVENRIWLARCANSGLSSIIDPYGKERVKSELFETRVLNYPIGLLDEYSIFTKIGPIFGLIPYWITVGILFVFIILPICKRFGVIKR